MNRKIIVIPFLAIFFMIGLTTFFDGYKDKDKGVEVTAQISRIAKETKRERIDGHYETRVSYKPYISYEYEGAKFTDVRYKTYKSSMDEGENIQIKIDKDDPSKIYYASDDMETGILFMVVSAICMIIVLKVNPKSYGGEEY